MDKQIIELKDNWRFHLGDVEPAWYKGFDDSDDSQWRSVRIPHDWSVEYPFSKDYSSGTGYLTGGIGWYRVRFRLPEEYRGKSIRLCFDGVYKNSKVWFNSYYLGKRPNGYVPFSYDITGMAEFGDTDNEISVRVDHTDIADSRWFTGSGITRKVTITVEENVHPEEYGVFFKTESLSKDYQSAQIAINHSIEISGTDRGKKDMSSVSSMEGRALYAESKLIDFEGNVAAVFKDEMRLKCGSINRIWMRGTVKNPKLWSDAEPSLYMLESSYRLEDSDEKYIVDRQFVGIRMVEFDPDRGLFVNGKSTKLKGVCVHHDGGVLGAAMKEEVWQRRLELLKESGCNAIRCSHNPHMPQLYDLCDRMGFFMMDEAFDEWENAKNKWSTGHNIYPPRHQGYYEDFPEWYQKDLEAMVLRDRNHPSVIMYSIGNEVDYPNDPYCHPMFETMTGNNDANKPESERRFDSNKPNMERLSVVARRLNKIVTGIDDSRPVTVAAAFPELSTHIGFIDSLDVVGYNYKEHLYGEDHKRFPEKTFLGSENGHGYKEWRAVTDNDFICGQFLWTGIDYLGEAHGWPVHGSTAGIITTAGNPKPEFLRRKTFWSDEPVVCILTRRVSDGEENWLPMSNSWDYEDGEEILVKVYVTDTVLKDAEARNSDVRMELYINGNITAESEDIDEDNAFVFKIPFEKGSLWAQFQEGALSEDEETIMCSGELRTPKGLDHLEIQLWQEDDLVSGASFEEASHKNGYLYQLHVGAFDRDNVPVRSSVSGGDFFTDRENIKEPSCEADYEEPLFMKDFPEISVSVEGAGELAGIDSGNLADPSSFTEPIRKLWNGEAVVYVRRAAQGEINVKISEKRHLDMNYEYRIS